MPEQYVSDSYRRRIDGLDLEDLEDERLKLFGAVCRFRYVEARIKEIHDTPAVPNREMIATCELRPGDWFMGGGSPRRPYRVDEVEAVDAGESTLIRCDGATWRLPRNQMIERIEQPEGATR